MKPAFGLGKTRRFDSTSSFPRDLMSTSRGCLRQVFEVTFPVVRVRSFGMFFQEDLGSKFPHVERKNEQCQLKATPSDQAATDIKDQVKRQAVLFVQMVKHMN